MKRNLLLAALVVTVLACSPQDGSESESTLPTSETTADVIPTDLEDEVFELINAEREAAGLLPLQKNAALDDVARGHSEDMRDRDYFSHTSPEGETLRHRLDAAGLDCNSCAENIALSGGSIDDRAQVVVERWMSSEGHRTNILDESGRGYAETGIGVAFDEDSGTYYFTQVFRSL